MALQSVIKIDHILLIWVVDQSLAHDQQKGIKRSNRSRSEIDHHKSDFEQWGLNSEIKTVGLCETYWFTDGKVSVKQEWPQALLLDEGQFAPDEDAVL
ncbi:hypothetical protein OUZ56_021680 [Daphnia magna]|uniref:Uncharacterized protein n=1 Tax=Daphnia magna TaxID=35525 RepID=A0ABR0AU64_9CRUS|nr:hypothetical protein OUZ56_021680 [Daphnia magna]